MTVKFVESAQGKIKKKKLLSVKITQWYFIKLQKNVKISSKFVTISKKKKKKIFGKIYINNI